VDSSPSPTVAALALTYWLVTLVALAAAVAGPYLLGVLVRRATRSLLRTLAAL